MITAMFEDGPGGSGAPGRLADFPRRAVWLFTARADDLLDLTDGVLRADGPVKTLVGLLLAPRTVAQAGACMTFSHRRIDVARMRWSLRAGPTALGPGAALPRTARTRDLKRRQWPVPGSPFLQPGIPGAPPAAGSLPEASFLRVFAAASPSRPTLRAILSR